MNGIVNGFHRFCREPANMIEGFDEMIAHPNERWILHHRLETHDKWGNLRQDIVPQWVLERIGIYYFRPASELIFLRASDHSSLHNSSRTDETRKKSSESRRKLIKSGWTFSDEARKKMAESHKGKKTWNSGLKGVQSHSEETRNKISEYQKTHTNSGRWSKGQRAWNKGLPSHTKGKHRYNNGIVNVYAYECPEGFKEGWDNALVR